VSTPEKPSRRWDRKPETEAETRFFDLRESGYDGPIDRHGYATDQYPTADEYFGKTD